MSLSYFDKMNAIAVCENVEDILSSSKLNIDEDYATILSCIMEDDLRAQFVEYMIKQGKTNLVVENISVIDVNQNWKIAKDNPEFCEIFFENFGQALENQSDIYDYTISDLEQASIETKAGKKLDGKAVILSNWEKISERSNSISRQQLLRVLNSTQEGKQIVDDNFSTLFYGPYMYSSFLNNSFSENLMTKEQVIPLILKEPTRMFAENFEVEDYLFDADNIVSLLDQVDELLETTASLETSQVQHTREAIEEYVSQNFEKLLSGLKEKASSRGEENYSIEQLKTIKKWDTDKHLMNQKFAANYEEISSNTKKEDIMDVIHLFADVGVQDKEIDIETIMKQTFSAIHDEDLQWAISRMASELLQDQNTSVKDMEIFGKGKFSRSVKIGEYIFKIGENRVTHEIPYDERIVQPLTRRKLEGKQDEEVYVEVQNLVDKDWYKGLSDQEVEEELYKIYSEMRDRGHRWTDVRKDNVGRLLKPNEAYFEVNGDTITPEDSAIGFVNRENERRVLPAGELVIIDTDFIFEQDKEKYSGSIASAHKKFEERYLQECADRDAKKAQEPPAMLTSAIEASKEQVSNKDIQAMSQSVVTRQKVQEKNQEPSLESEEYSK